MENFWCFRLDEAIEALLITGVALELCHSCLLQCLAEERSLSQSVYAALIIRSGYILFISSFIESIDKTRYVIFFESHSLNLPKSTHPNANPH